MPVTLFTLSLVLPALKKTHIPLRAQVLNGSMDHIRALLANLMKVEQYINMTSDKNNSPLIETILAGESTSFYRTRICIRIRFGNLFDYLDNQEFENERRGSIAKLILAAGANILANPGKKRKMGSTQERF